MSRSTASELSKLLVQFEADIHSEVQRHGPSPYGEWGALAELSVEGYRKVTLSRVKASFRMIRTMCGLERGYYAFRKFLYANTTLKQINQILEEHYRG